MIAAVDTATVVMIIVGVVALIGVAVYFGHKAAKKRRAALLAAAEKLGLRFDPKRTDAHNDELAQFAEFKQGFGQSASNLFTGSMEALGHSLPTILGEFQYKTQSTDSKGNTTTTHHNFSFGYFTLPFSAPQVVIRKEHFFDRIASAIGFDDIDFESVEFSKAFHVTSKDKRFAYDLCHAPMMEFLLKERPLKIQVDGDGLLITDGGGRWKPEDYAKHAGAALAFLELWPRHLQADLLGSAQEHTS